MTDEDKQFFTELVTTAIAEQAHTRCNDCICFGEGGVQAHNEDHEFVRKAARVVTRAEELQWTGLKAVVTVISVSIVGWILWALFGLKLLTK